MSSCLIAQKVVQILQLKIKTALRSEKIIRFTLGASEFGQTLDANMKLNKDCHSKKTRFFLLKV